MLLFFVPKIYGNIMYYTKKNRTSTVDGAQHICVDTTTPPKLPCGTYDNHLMLLCSHPDMVHSITLHKTLNSTLQYKH